MNKDKLQNKLVPELRFSGFNDEWQLKSLSKCADVIDPHPSHRAPAAVSSGIPFIGIGDISENGGLDTKNVRLVSKEIYDEHTDRYQLKNGDFAYGRVASVGKVVDLSNNVDKIYTYSPTLAIIQPKSINSKYLKIFCESGFFITQVKSKTSGSTRKSIGMQNLRILKIAIPKKIEEQQKIANCLSSLDNLITAETEKLDHLKDHKKGLLQQLFPANGETKPQFRFPEFENDGDWEEKCVNDFFEVGSSKRVLQKDWTNKGVPFYRTRELVSLSKNEPFGSEIYISEELFLELSEKYGTPQQGDFLVSGVGTLGILYQVKENDKFYFKDGNVIWFKLTSGIVSDYFKHCFHTKYFQKQIFGQSSASTVGTYTISNARKTKFWKPVKKEEQQKIANCLSSADELIEAQKNKIETLYAHKKGLMQQMFPKTTNI